MHIARETFARRSKNFQQSHDVSLNAKVSCSSKNLSSCLQDFQPDMPLPSECMSKAVYFVFSVGPQYLSFSFTKDSHSAQYYISAEQITFLYRSVVAAATGSA